MIKQKGLWDYHLVILILMTITLHINIASIWLKYKDLKLHIQMDLQELIELNLELTVMRMVWIIDPMDTYILMKIKYQIKQTFI